MPSSNCVQIKCPLSHAEAIGGTEEALLELETMLELEAMLELETMDELDATDETTELAALLELETSGVSGPHAASMHDAAIKDKLLRMVVYLVCW